MAMVKVRWMNWSKGGFSSCSIDGWEERRHYPTTDMVGKWQVDPGQTGGRRKSTTRLEDHKRWMIYAQEALNKGRCWSRRHPHADRCVTSERIHPYLIYASQFGAEVIWISRRGRETPTTMETELINAFYQHYGALPVANRQWPRELRDQLKGAE